MRWTMDEITSWICYDARNAKPGSKTGKAGGGDGQRARSALFQRLWHNGQQVKFDSSPDGYGLERDGLQRYFFIVRAGDAATLPGRRLPSTRPTTSMFMTRIAIHPARRLRAAKARQQ